MVDRYDPLSGNYFPADLEKTNVASASAAASTSKDSYTKTIKMSLVKGKTYKFWFKYKYEDPNTKEVKLSDSSPIWKETFAIPNLTKGVLNLTLTAGYKSYGVKFDLDPLSVQEDIVIYESLTSTSLGNEVYRGTSTNVTIPTNSIATRWITVRTRDKWDDLNKTDTGPLSVTPLNPDPDTSTPPSAPTGVSVAGSIDPDDKSGFSAQIDVSWTASTDTNTAGYVIRWSTQNPVTVTNPVWEYGQVDGKTTTKFTVTGLIPNTLYYYQVTAKSPYNAISWASPASGTFGPIVDANAPADAFAQLRSILSIGGKTADLFKIGTGISQTINTSSTITPVQTSGNYSGIILNKSTTNVGHNYWLNTGQFRVGSASAFLYWDGSDLYTTGKINATGGSFSGDVQLSAGSLYAGTLPNSGQRVRLNSSGVFAYNSSGAQTFSLDTAGYLNSTSGLIGGWALGATTLSNNGVVLDSANGQISAGSAPSNSVYLSSTGNYRMWAGSQSPTDAAAKFKIGSDGTLYATGAVIGLGAGSTGPFASTDALNSYTLTSVTSGINSRLQNVEGAYVSVSTLNSSVATKNTTFVTADSTQPYANKAGDLWINGGDNNSIWTANSAGYNWTEKSNGKYATTTQLSTKLSAGGYAIAAQDGQITNITSNGIFITPGNFKISNTNDTAPSSGGYMLINSAGITAYDGTDTTFAISSSGGNAAFKGNISGSTGSFTGTLISGTDSTASGYINTGATKTVSGYGDVKYLQVKAIGLQSTSNSGWVSTIYPWLDNSYSLGTSSYSWNYLYLGGNANFGGGTTYKIESNGDATMNGYAVTGGYGIFSHWSPRFDNTYDLGGSGAGSSLGVTRRWKVVYSNNSAIATSDSRLKTSVRDSELGLDFINKLRPVTYKWIEGSKEPVFEDKEVKHYGPDGIKVEKIEIVKAQKIIGKDENGNDIYESISIPGKRRHAGFLAQEVKQVLDELEVEDFGGWVSDNVDDPEALQSLRYEEFVPPLAKAVQELSDMVESLQQEINTLKGI